jgi:3-mercaptopyruvate sulfurtransferase SseA
MRSKRRAPKKTNTLLPVALIGLGTLLVIGLLVWQAFRSSPITSAPAAQERGIPFPEIDRVSLADARTAMDGQDAVFLDVRDPSAFEAGRIPGSVNIPLGELETRFAELDPNQWIITYCT